MKGAWLKWLSPGVKFGGNTAKRHAGVTGETEDEM